MKLGEALTLRARQASKLGELRARIISNALRQEDTNANEDAPALIEEYTDLSTEHRDIVKRIVKTNILTRVGTPADQDADVFLYDLLAERDDLTRQRAVRQAAADAANPGRDAYRYMRTEIKYVPAVNVQGLRVEIDQYTNSLNELDTRIQGINWATDLLL